MRHPLATPSTRTVAFSGFSWETGPGVRSVELRRPLAITVIGGLLLATVLTLTVIPAGYLLVGGRVGLRKLAEEDA